MWLGDMLNARLVSVPAIKAQIDTRIYPGHLPQSPTLDALTYQIISRAPTESNTQIFETRVQIDCWAKTYNRAHALATLVQKALRFYGQTDGSGNRIISMYDANQSDDYEDGQELWRVSVDMIAIVFES